ncbi:MAG: hypothetical protein AAFQ78_03005, partial [Bacteroidota bacterium]
MPRAVCYQLLSVLCLLQACRSDPAAVPILQAQHTSTDHSIGSATEMTSLPSIPTPAPGRPALLVRIPSTVNAFNLVHSPDGKQPPAVGTTQALVEAFNKPTSAATTSLIDLFRTYNNFFDQWSFADTDLRSILAYSTLAKIRLSSVRIEALTKEERASSAAAIRTQLLHYLEVWRRKIDQGYAKKHFTQGLAQVLQHIDTTIFANNPTPLLELGESLLAKLPTEKSHLTIHTYPSHRHALNALHQILIHLKTVCPDKWDADNPDGLYCRFKQQIDTLSEASYYPIRYQAKLI